MKYAFLLSYYFYCNGIHQDVHTDERAMQTMNTGDVTIQFCSTMWTGLHWARFNIPSNTLQVISGTGFTGQTT